MRSRRAAVAASMALLLVGVLGLVPTQVGADPADVGEWLAPFSEGRAFDAAAPADEEDSDLHPTAVSLVVLPDGNIVYWSGLDDTENLDGPIAASGGPEVQESRTRHLDLSGYFASGNTSAIPTSAWSTPTPEDGGGGDLFCADQRLLADGTVLAAGGTIWTNEDEATIEEAKNLVKEHTDDTPAEGIADETPVDGLGRTELWGRKNTRIYNPASKTWTQAGDMDKGRWYPGIITLADGRLLVAGGVGRLIYNSSAAPGGAPSEELLPVNVHDTEYYQNGTWTANTNDASKASLPLFPRLHLMPNGKVLYTANGQTWGPFGQDAEQLGWDALRWFNPTTDAWEDGGRGGLGVRSGAIDVLMRLEPPYTEAKILLAGGTLGSSPGSYVANNLTEIVTWNGSSAPTRTLSGSLNNIRWYSSGILLPTGEVVAVSGADLDEVIWPGFEHAVREAEIFNPATGIWSKLAAGTRDRTYHNTAVLLKDGSILVGGHSPIVAGYGQDHSTVPTFANNFKDPSFEILKPPYLSRGPRPAITSAPSTVTRGLSFNVTTPDAADGTLQVVLSRLPSTTHVTDADQRSVLVGHTNNGNGTISITLDSNAAVLPGGYYYLFLLKDNGQGPTPSVASIVKVNVL